jgi:hypothetical protein
MYSYDRRLTAGVREKALGPGVKTFPEAQALLKTKGKYHTILTDTQTGLLHVVRNLDLSKFPGGRWVQEPTYVRNW